MEYEANGIITFTPTSKLRLSSELSFISPSEANITLLSESDDKLSVSIKLQAEEDNTAKELAQLELSRICDILSFFHNTPIVESRVTGIKYQKLTPQGKHIVVGEAMVGIDAILSLVKILDEKSLEGLNSDLGREYNPEFREVINIWREALRSESATEQFYSLYRLMEKLFGNSEKMDEWIRTRNPSVQLCSGNKFRRNEHTNYTFLRDNVHYKEERKVFPVKEIQENLSSFQSLVKQAIKERFGI